MKHIAKVELIDIDNIKVEIYKYLRKELKLLSKEAKDLSSNGKIIDFNGDINKAFKFYNDFSDSNIGCKECC